MNLTSLGFDESFRAHARDLLQPGQELARVITVDRGAFVVRGTNGELNAVLTGKLSYETASVSDLPCVGDWVVIELASDTQAVIHAVLPRKSLLRRKSPGKTVDFQLIAANLDTAFIVQSCHYDFNVRRLDRYLVAVHETGIHPVILLSKTDLLSPGELDDLIDRILNSGITAQVLPLSTLNGDGLETFMQQLMPGRSYCLIGSSGVGKTTLLNHLLGRETFETRPVSATGEGVHTTSRRQLHLLDNGALLVDTPGMRELGLLGAQESVDDSFSSIQELATRCRFADCSHTAEPGCAVLKALGDGSLSEAHYQSFLKLRRESAHNDRSYVEKRHKDKDFGHMVRSVMKDKKRFRKGKY